MDKQPIGLIGLGLMGTALADRFLGATWPVVGYDIDAARREAFKRAGGEVADDIATIARRCKRIVLSLPTTKAVEQVIQDMEEALGPPAILIDTTTGDPVRVGELGKRLAGRGIGYLDATISGSSAQTARGDVVVMAGGRKTHFDVCRDIFDCFARSTFHLGDWGAGTRMKLVTNLVLGLNRAALAEGLTFAVANGLDAENALAVLSQSAAYSRVMDTKGRKMVDGDFSPQAKLSQHLKDVRLILEEASRHDAALPLTEIHRELLERAEAMGLGEADNSAIIRAFS